MHANFSSRFARIAPVFLLIALMLQGCGGKTDAQKSGENKPVASGNSKAVAGKWTVTAAAQFPEDNIGKTYLFTEDGKYEFGSGKSIAKGNYAVADDMLTLDMGGGVKIVFKYAASGNTLTLTGQNTQQGFTLQRQ